MIGDWAIESSFWAGLKEKTHLNKECQVKMCWTLYYPQLLVQKMMGSEVCSMDKNSHCLCCIQIKKDTVYKGRCFSLMSQMIYGKHGFMIKTAESVSCSMHSDSLQLHGYNWKRLSCPLRSVGKNTGMDSHSFTRIFLTQESNLDLFYYRWFFLE